MNREVCGECSAPKELCECEYDVVLDVLQKHHDKLWEMTKRNMECEFLGMGIMDTIRLERMDEIKEAIRWWKERAEIQRLRAENELLREAVKAEREECARVCDEVGGRDSDSHAWDAAAAIRARGET